MSWLLCCISPGAPGELYAINKQSCANGAAKPASSSKETRNSLPACRGTSLDQAEDTVPRSLLHAPSSRVRKASQHGLRLSEETLASALSTTPTSLNPLAYVFPFANDEVEDFSMGQTREEVDALGCYAPPQHRSRVDFADLCGSLEDLAYLGEGSNGIVYSALWHGARVAVKFLLANNNDSSHLQRSLTEAVLTRVLSHPCVVQCFATASSQLTPEVREAICARCQRHLSLLNSSSLGRSVAAAVLQQEQQEQEQQQQQQQQQQLLPSTCGERHGPSSPHHQLRTSHSSLQHQSRTATAHPRLTPTPPPPQPQPQPHPMQASQSASRSPSLSQSQAQSSLLLQSHDQISPLGTGRPGPPCGSTPSSSEHQHQRRQHQQGPQQQPQLSPRPMSVATGSVEVSGEGAGADVGSEVAPGRSGGISLLEALQDLAADAAGRHCTVVVMEYMDAGTMHEAIIRGDFSARRSVEQRSKLLALLLTAQELAQGMAHLHGLDILHGDLKPTNVLLKGSPCHFGSRGAGLACTDPRGYTAKIADLGLARPCSDGTAELSSDQWGALAYLAPEAAKGSCCKASDVYSFGVMLWEMSAGVRPYLGLTTPQVLMGLVTGTLQLTWPSDGSLYGPLRSLAIACTDFNAAERPTFEVAARILGRMVRHIRAAAEPLRQRHSSALSVETAAAAAAAAAAATAFAAAGSNRFYSPGGGGGDGAKCLLSRASRSMPVYMPSTGTGAGAVVAASALLTGPLQQQQQQQQQTPSGGAGSALLRAPPLAPGEGAT